MPTYREYRDVVDDPTIKLKLREFLLSSANEAEFKARCRKEFGDNISLVVDWQQSPNNQRSVILGLIRRKSASRRIEASVIV
jgi:hypothetical protein